ncbi:MAG: galactose mutarotase [Muribaculaceae bacterium]|nr:galactose mutarotase [Muribaculaceae bacterium]
MQVETRKYPSEKGEITLLTLTNASGAKVTLCNLGAGIVGVEVPDRNGNMADVVLGYADPTDYYYDGPCAGKVPGRCANRIARGHFSLDGKDYHLAINNGPNALHGGPEGFQNQLWQTELLADNRVRFTYCAKDGEEGYPGNMTATATYEWTDDCELKLELAAETDAPTVVNLTNHAYFNLAGHDSGSVLDHLLTLDAHLYLPTDDTLIPTGDLVSVKNTPMDFTEPKGLGVDIKAEFPALVYGKGYDNCYVIDGWNKGTLRRAARLEDPASGRVLEVLTTQPGVQIYTGNWLAGCPANKAGRPYEDYEGVAIECQGLPDSINKPQFPSVVLRPDKKYNESIIFKFTHN